MQQKETRAYVLLTALVICGLASSIITAPKVAHIGINFPFSNIIFSIFTYPIIDCICELWGKQAAKQTLWLGLASQLLIVLLVQLSIYIPYPAFWTLQTAYQSVLSVGGRVFIAGFLGFSLSQIFDIFIYQKIKYASKGKRLWLRSNVSTYLGQMLDSLIFVNIIFWQSNHKLSILLGSIIVKIFISLAMTPIVYLIVIAINAYLESNTLAFSAYSERLAD